MKPGNETMSADWINKTFILSVNIENQSLLAIAFSQCLAQQAVLSDQAGI